MADDSGDVDDNSNAPDAEPQDVSSRKQSKKRLSRSERKRLKKQRKAAAVAPPSSACACEEGKDDEDPRCGQSKPRPAEEVTNEEEYLTDYVPVPLPSENAASAKSKDAKRLGSWFPNAVVIKSTAAAAAAAQNGKRNGNDNDKNQGVKNDELPSSSSLVLFYQYADPQFSAAAVGRLVAYLTAVAKARLLAGRIRVAPEGLNATVSSMSARNLRHFAQDLRTFAPNIFSGTDFKYIDNLPSDRHFKELKLLPVKELVFYGISDKEAPLGEGGVHLDAKEYHKMLEKKNAVVIDIRNHYEAVLGRFDGQEQAKTNETLEEQCGPGDQDRNGATYIDPKMRKSTDFPDWLAKPDTQQTLEGKTVLMYCTGGVRCERASAYLKRQMGDRVQGVYQLKGGIERYLKAFPDGGHWRGKNFVFDKREAVGVDAMEGDGGVLQKKKKSATVEGANCCVCSAPWDRYVGKKKCYTCGVPVLMCDACMSQKPDRTPGKELSVRCPLCVEQGITVPAADVEYTDNGVRVQGPQVDGKAASSVLKWGGGTASKKKQQRRMKRRLCQFGTECVRADCMFAHPEREMKTGGKKRLKA